MGEFAAHQACAGPSTHRRTHKAASGPVRKPVRLPKRREAASGQDNARRAQGHAGTGKEKHRALTHNTNTNHSTHNAQPSSNKEHVPRHQRSNETSGPKYTKKQARGRVGGRARA